MPVPVVPPPPVVGPQMPWMLGGQPFAPPSLAPPALLTQLTPAERAAMTVNDPSYWARVGNGPVGQAAPTIASQLAPQAAPTAAEAAAPAVVEAAAPLAGRTGLATRLAGSGGPTWLTARLAGQPTAGLGLRSLQAGSLGRAGLYGLGGYLAGQGVEKVVGHREGTLDDALRNAVTGAGVGMGIGSVVPLVGTGVGGLLGGGFGFAHGLLTGRGSDEGEAERAYTKQEDKFCETLDRFSASPDLRRQFMTQFQLSTEGLKRGEINDVAKQMRAALPDLIAQDYSMRKDNARRNAMFAAAQAWMAPMMEGAFDRSTQFADQLSQSMRESAQTIKSPSARAFAMQDAARIPFDNATQQAYLMQQFASLPGLYGMNTQTGNNGIPQMDFSSIINATPLQGQQQPFMFGQQQQQAYPAQ